MNRRTVKVVENLIGFCFLAGFLWLIWGWWSFSGPYRWIAVLELAVFHSYGAISTFVIGVVGLAAALLGSLKLLRPLGVGVPNPGPRPTPSEAKAKAEQALGRMLLGAGAAALVVVVAAGVALMNEGRGGPATATLDLSSGSSLPEGAKLVRLIGFSRPELIVGIQTKQTPGVSSDFESYMAVVGPQWQPSEPVPVIVEGSPALGLRATTMEMQERGKVLPVSLPLAAVRSTTSGFAKYLLERNGAKTDSHTVVLDTDLNSVHETLLTTFALGMLVALAGLGVGIASLRSPARAVATKRT